MVSLVVKIVPQRSLWKRCKTNTPENTHMLLLPLENQVKNFNIQHQS